MFVVFVTCDSSSCTRRLHGRANNLPAARKISALQALGWGYALGGFLLGGCAYSYTDRHGQLHVVGLAAVTVAPTRSGASNPPTVEVKNLGLLVYSTPLSKGISVGYNREAISQPATVVSTQKTPLTKTPDHPAQKNSPP